MKKINLLNVSDLCVSVDGHSLLKSLNLKAKTGDVIAIIGPNGAGKSSFLKTLMHHYAFKVTKGDIKFNNKSIKNASTDEIAKLGFFYLAQSPMELEGVKLIDLYKIIANTHSAKKVDPISLHMLVTPRFKDLNLDLDLLKRSNNVNFSGGQKKKNELEQNKNDYDAVLIVTDAHLKDSIGTRTLINAVNKINKNVYLL